MDDNEIIGLYFMRDERAIAETQIKYHGYCFSIANGILNDRQDAEEAVNDTYNGAWNSIPPNNPSNLAVYIGRITRNLSLKKLRDRQAQKRGGNVPTVALDELDQCIPDGKSIDDQLEDARLSEILNHFLGTLPVTERRVFVCRYWYSDSIDEICARFGFGQSKVKCMLMRTRKKLLERLTKEGIFI